MFLINFIVVVAAGNEGDEGAYTVGNPASSPGAFSVASVGNDYDHYDCSFSAQGVSSRIRKFLKALRIHVYLPFIYTNIACNLPVNSTTSEKDTKILIDGIVTVPSNNISHACGYVDSNVKGKVVMIAYAVCKLDEQMKNLYDAGAVGAIVYETSEKGHITLRSSSSYLPFVLVSYSDYVAIYRGMSANTLIRFSQNLPSYLFKNEKYGSTASWFTSVGPTANLDMNPHIAAVGHSFYSTIPVNRGSYIFMQGTSMACPYVSGSIALFIQQKGIGKISPKVVHEKFQNYAFQTNAYNRTSGLIENPLRVGAGAVQGKLDRI